MDTSIVKTEESGFSFNLEWIAEGSGIGEEICGIDKDCIVVPGLEKVEVEDYVEIQVTEEEVIADQWGTSHNGLEEDSINGLRFVEEGGEIIVPLPEVQDEYSRLHPYPCDFCSRRFAKKSALTTHMVEHQVEKIHGCNMCGEHYKRKHDLVEHMKQHAYAPTRSLEEDDFSKPINGEEEEGDVIDGINQQRGIKNIKGKRKKGLKIGKNDGVKKRGSSRSIRQVVHREDEPLFNPNYLEESEYEDIREAVVPPPEPSPIRFPIIDPSRPYVCQDCGVGFAREKAFISHCLIHNGDSAFECERCHEMFQTSEQLADHDNIKHGRLYTRTFTSKSSDGGTFQCDHCSTSFHWYNQLKKHQRDNPKCGEGNSEGFMCLLCNVVYDTEEQLAIHRGIHETFVGVQGVHSCDICGEVYEHSQELKDHVRIKHKQHVCHFCDSVFKDARSLSKHSLSHIDERTFPCHICGARFHNRGKLKKHLTMHDDEKKGATCSECGITVAEGKSLMAHMQNEHGLNMSRLFPCSQCGKTFTSRSSQQIHVRVHTGEKPYGCRFCWKAFADGGTLRKHERIHTGEKPYVCPVCQKAFNQRVVLREHVRAHHSGSESRLSSNCYECIVCGKMFGNSRELCLHLVHHSDENTAKHRLPSSSPRKLVGKRRKYPNTLFTQQFKKEPLSEEVTDSSEEDNETFGNKNLTIPEIEEDPLKIGEVKRARIVRSGKKGYHKGTNKRFVRGKGKAARLMNSASYASKYVVTRTELDTISFPDPLTITEEEPIVGIMDDMEEYQPQRSRPRTKNVSYHNNKTESKFELATFPLDSLPTNKPKRKKGCGRRVKREPIDTQFVNGIDPSLFEESGEAIETCIVDDIGVELKLEVQTTEADDFSDPSELCIKTEIVSCDMCSEVFSNRSDLLKHIQIHI